MKRNFFKLNYEDLLDLNYVLKPEFDLINKFPKYLKSQSVFISIKRYFLIMIKSLLKGEYIYPQGNGISYLFISTSFNNDRVLVPLANILPNSLVIGTNHGKRLPKFLAYLYSLPYFFKTAIHRKNATGYERQVLTSFFDRFWSTYGYYKMIYKTLKKIRPKVVIISNDHLLLYRCIIRASKKLNLKTVYIQHAGTAPHFPPLEFDYALLDGKVAYDSYMTHGAKNTAKIFLAGSPRYDDIFSIRQSRTTQKAIGVAVNLIDDFDRVTNYIQSIKKSYTGTIILRLHPGMQGGAKSRYDEFASANGIFTSNPKVEDIKGYLAKVDLIVANDSFIHFEAILSGIQSIQYLFSSIARDSYGFNKNQLISTIEEPNETFNFINRGISVVQQGYLQATIANYSQLENGVSTLSAYSTILQTAL